MNKMKAGGNNDAPPFPLRAFFLGAVLGWTVLLAALAGWNGRQAYVATLETARASARESYGKDLVYRRWAAMHGGVYVPLTPATPPNPFLAYLPEREITTPSGRKLTLVNPAYMTRQVHELGKKDYGAQGHITSMRPVRPENAPDEWEKRALQAFERGVPEAASVESLDGIPHLRFMRPLTTEPECLKCHVEHGYKVGEIRGGIGVALPWAPFRGALRRQQTVIALGYGGVWAFGILGMILARNRIRVHLSERRRMEKALTHSNDLMRYVIEHNRGAVAIHDRDLRYVYVSRRYLEEYNVQERDVIGRHHYDVFPDLPQKWRDVHQKALAGEISSAEDDPYVRADGTVEWTRWECRPWHEADGSIGGIIVYTEIITERKRAEDALRENERRYRSLVETTRAIAWELDLETLAFTYIGPQIGSLTGYPPEMWKDFDFWAGTVHPADREGAVTFCRIEAAGGRDHEFDYRMNAADGRVLWIKDLVTVVREADRPVALRGFMIDTTERMRVEEERERLRSQLLQSQKMESVGRLAGGVAHDFNNMLGVILGHAELSLERIDPDHPLHADLLEIRKAAERSANLTRQLLAFARRQTVAPRVLNLNEAIEGLLKLMQRLIGEDIALRWQPTGASWPVRVDPSQLDQILANLCVNARDAIAGVGTVTVGTANVILDETYCAAHAGSVPGEYVRLAVSDDGCGMDQETMAHLFEPFFTTKGPGKGTGLGLATVYGIVKQNNGFIDVASEPGEGTTFTIHLPRHAGEAEPVKMSEGHGPERRGRETVLLVEDEPDMLHLAAKLLERQGYTVLAAGSPGEAIRLAREHGGAIHLLMTDVVMPEMNGRDLAQDLLSRHPRLKCLFTSGYPADVIARHGVLDERIHFIQKPYAIRALAAKVREALDLRQE